MQKRTLKLHRDAEKALASVPSFAQFKRGKLPKPLHQIGGPRVFATHLIAVSSEHSAWFMWKDGSTLVETSFYAYLFAHVGASRNLYPLCHFHWHPSHKGIHVKTPCNSDLTYTNRGLPGAKELAIKGTKSSYDPRIEQDRLQLIELFCKACGIRFGNATLI